MADVVEVGDSKQAQFFPQSKIIKFGNEANASFRLLHDEPGEAIAERGRTTWRTKSMSAQFYDVDDVEQDDGHEFAVTLLTRPESPILTFSMQDKGIAEWAYQPPLTNLNPDGSTWEDNGRGGERRRPAHVNGSYAAYCGKAGDYTRVGGHNYRSGKALHIYRPWAQDANGARVWCALNIADQRLTITVPQDFINGAEYPILVDPTFGYSGTAASDDNIGTAHCLFKANTTPASSGTLDSITIKGRLRNGTPTFETAIYSDVAGVPTARLAAVNSGGTAFGASDAEVTTNITYAGLTSAVQYWLGCRCQGSQNGVLDAWFKFDSVATGTVIFRYLVDVSPAISSWEATAVGYTNTIEDEKVYVFGTYTATAPSDAQEWFASRPDRTRQRTPQIGY